MKNTSKSKNRLELLDMVTEAVTSDRIFETINYQTQSEDKIKQFMYPNILSSFKKFLMEQRGYDANVADMKSNKVYFGKVTRKLQSKT